ncbi:MAG: acyl-CoA dehydrogenase family protein [Neisseria sp.]|nr:acyl-CoA dehydrogenase family protein [Neisseria sp.]
MSRETLLQQTAELAKTQLKPLVEDIDRKGFYPEAFMRALGGIGGYAAVGTPQEGGSGLGLGVQIEVLREVGKVCGATAFSAWCQAACAWYLHQSPNQEVKNRHLQDVLNGAVLAGTGMSNTVKHLAGIEKHQLQGVRAQGGYTVNGILPWVSNLGEEHIWANTAQTADGYVMFITGGRQKGVSLIPCPEFCGLEGTRTYAIKFEDVFIPDEDIIARPDQFADYIATIKSGFILLQIGIGAGIIDGCLAEIAAADAGSETNCFLDNGYEELNGRYQAVLAETMTLADAAYRNQPELLETLRLREKAAWLCLDAAQSAALHTGAAGYLMQSPVQRRLREAMFVAIVTPAIKHLRKEISELEFVGDSGFSI